MGIISRRPMSIVLMLCLMAVAVAAVLARVEQPAAAGADGGRLVAGVAVGVVVEAQDPETRGRIKVKFPWLPGERGGKTSFWARVALPLAGAERASFVLPEIDDEVLVAFEHGDLRRPVVVGFLWDGRKPPAEDPSR